MVDTRPGRRGRVVPLASLWPRGLVGQVVAVLLAALLLEVVGSSIVYDQFASLLPRREAVDDVAERLAVATRVVGSIAPADRVRVVGELSGGLLSLSWMPATEPDVGADERRIGEEGRQDQAVAALLAAQPSLGQHGMRLSGGEGGTVAGTLGLPDGTRLRFSVAPTPRLSAALLELVASTTLLSACLLVAAALVVRTLGAPLRQLARVADSIGHGPPVVLAESGPREVRQVARALNTMQARLVRLLREQTEILAAVSHDLRTPIARLRLRAGFLDDALAVPAIEADLREMEAMIEAVLAFLGGEADPEARRTLDLAALAATAVDEAVDAGHDVAYHGPRHAVLEGRPLEIRRAVANLVGNAVKYADGPVRVEVRTVPPEPGAPATLCVAVADRGPGIAEDQLRAVLEPFRRVDRSRNAGTGGIGLGLAIVRRAAVRDGGRVVLSNRPGGGLLAELFLPVRPG